MVEGIINFIGTLLSQIFVGLVLGFCWNSSMTELGFNALSPKAAVSAWLGFLTGFVLLTYIFVNMLKNTMVSGIVSVDPESKKNSLPPDDDQSAQ